MKNKYFALANGYGLWLLPLVAAGVLFLSPSIFYSLISFNTSSLLQAGLVVASEGKVHRRLKGDTLWAPIHTIPSIFFGDTISTSKDASAELSITEDPESRIKILENTTVRILLIGEEIVLIVKSGKVETKASKTRLVIENLVSPEDDNAISEDPAPEAPSVHQQAQVSTFLYPADKSILLLQKPSTVILTTGINCLDSCTIEVMRNSSRVDNKKFSKGQIMTVVLKLDQSSVGTWKWFVQQGDTKSEQSFQVRVYSVIEFQKALTLGVPIDVIQ